MKKKYITPDMEVIKIQKAYLLAGSGVNDGAPVYDEYDSNDISYQYTAAPIINLTQGDNSPLGHLREDINLLTN